MNPRYMRQITWTGLVLLILAAGAGVHWAAPAAARAKAPVRSLSTDGRLIAPSPTTLEILDDRGADFRYWRTDLFLEKSDNHYAMTRQLRWKTAVPVHAAM